MKKLIAVVLCAALLAVCMPVAIAADGSSDELKLCSVSDIHYFPAAYYGDMSDAVVSEFYGHNKYAPDQKAVFDSFCAAVADKAKNEGLKYVIIPGDLTMDGEYDGHVELASRLEQLEADTGVKVFVINGNHDINNTAAFSFATNTKSAARSTTPEEFKSIYANCGYDEAYHTYTPDTGKAGMLSYSVKLTEGYRLIMIDAGLYSADATDSGKDQWETGGNISSGLMTWLLDEIADAKADGEIPIGVTHWNLSGQNYLQQYLVQGFCMRNCTEVADKLADAGMHYVFTGHSHSMDISSATSDAGETIYSIMTGALSEFPDEFRMTDFTTASDGSISMTSDVCDADCVKPITFGGTTYSQPFKYQAFKLQYQGSATNYLLSMCEGMLDDYIDEIKADGGIVKFLKAKFGIDVQSLLSNLFSSDTEVGGVKLSVIGAVISTDSIMSFLSDLDSQIVTSYVDDPQVLYDLLRKGIDDICSVKVSDVSSTKFLADYGVGESDGGGTLGDMILETFIYMVGGNEDISDDAFAQDFLAKCTSGDMVYTLIDALKKGVIDDILYNGLLAKLQVKISPLFVTDLKYIAPALDLTYDEVMQLLNKDSSYKTLVDIILSSGALKKYGTSLDEILDYFVKNYLTSSQAEGTGTELALIIGGCVQDSDPVEKGDYGYTYVYSGPVEVTPDHTNLREPSLVSLTYGADPQTELNISWYTRYSVTGGDIEIYKYENGQEVPVFSGTPTDSTDSLKITSATSAVDRKDYGADVGVFGILPYTIHTQRHIVSLSGLTPGATYYFRVGDAAKGWWSKAGSFTTDSSSGAFTFFHMSDSQSQSYVQYQRWAQVIATAKELYPNASFMLHTGDFADNGSVFRQWEWGFDAAEDELLNLPIMPATGNHENFDESSTVLNFALTGLPDGENTTTGVRYSFDYSNAHFMVLNTNDLKSDGTLSDEQYNWLVNDAKSSDAQWKIVAFHKAIYSNAEHYDDKDVVGLRKQLASLMYDLGIDLVLEGHDHVYMRTDVLKNNKVSSDSDSAVLNENGTAYLSMVDPDGTIYVISGTAGVKRYKSTDDYTDYFPKAEKSLNSVDPMFSAITVDGDNLFLNAYSVNTSTGAATKVDSFAISKTYVTALLGDVDNDGVITAADARLALRHSISTGVLTGRDFLAADADSDNKLTSADARLILRAAIGLEKLTPATVTKRSNKIGVAETTTAAATTTKKSIFSLF